MVVAFPRGSMGLKQQINKLTKQGSRLSLPGVKAARAAMQARGPVFPRNDLDLSPTILPKNPGALEIGLILVDEYVSAKRFALLQSPPLPESQRL